MNAWTGHAVLVVSVSLGRVLRSCINRLFAFAVTQEGGSVGQAAIVCTWSSLQRVSNAASQTRVAAVMAYGQLSASLGEAERIISR
jgi:hypothetical protein